MNTKILPEEIQTRRLLLRRPEKGDAKAFYGYASGGSVGPMPGWQPHRSEKEPTQIIQHYAKEGNVLAITLQEQGEMIGTVGLHKDEHRPGTDTWQLGYALSPAYWHQGIAAEAAMAVMKYAFEVNLMPILTAYCYPENDRSRHLLEHLGFSHEGCLRKGYLLYDGSIHDLDCFSLTFEEYVARFC